MTKEIQWPDYVVKSAYQWASDLQITILDPDGWRIDKKEMSDIISKEEFLRRAAMSTIICSGEIMLNWDKL